MKKKIFILVVVIGGLLLAGESYYFNGQYVGKYVGMGDTSQREYASLDKAIELEQEGSVEEANEVYVTLIASTDDDIVLERSIREYGRNLAQGDALAGLRKNIELASNPRIRATARAGAVEGLARGYKYDTAVDKDTLSKEIFKNAPFKELRARAGDDVPDYVVLLEYANILSPRPVATAMLAEHYAQEMHNGDERAEVDLQEMLSLLDTLIPEIPEGSPNIPVALTYEASALLYASAAGENYNGRYADQVFEKAVGAAADIHTKLNLVFTDDSFEDIQKALKLSYFSVDTQFEVIFRTFTELPVLNQAEGMFDRYRQYLTEEGSEPPPRLVKLLEKLSIKYPSVMDLVETKQ